jgi:hypothetical protein
MTVGIPALPFKAAVFDPQNIGPISARIMEQYGQEQ